MPRCPSSVSEYREQATRAEAEACIAALLVESGGFKVASMEEASGVQLPGEGPEGLAPSRRVLITALDRTVEAAPGG